MQDFADKRDEVINLILRGNQMMKRHAEERQQILDRIIDLTKRNEDKYRSQIDKAIDYLEVIQDQVNDMYIQEVEKVSPDEILKYKKLTIINKVIAELDKKVENMKSYDFEIQLATENIRARDELIGILEEYIDIENATIHKVISELEESENEINLTKKKFRTFDKLSKHDPRFKALEIISRHPQGISFTQLRHMLETTNYEANKIINELIRMEIIQQSPKGELLSIIDQENVALFSAFPEINV